MPIKGKGEDKVKVLNAEKEEFVLKEDAAVQTDRLVGNNIRHTLTVPFLLYKLFIDILLKTFAFEYSPVMFQLLFAP